MTDRHPIPLAFSRIQGKPVLADFSGGRLTTDAGVPLLGEVAQRTGLFRALDRVIPDPRQPEMIAHDRQAMLAQRIMVIAPGCEDLNDHQSLRDDPARQLAAGRRPEPDAPLASPPTLRRLENRADRKASVAIAGVLVDQFLAAHPRPPEHLILDLDATDDPTHGDQGRRFFHGYHDRHCLLPLHVLCGDELLAAYLRPGKIDAAGHARAMLKLLLGKLRAAWPEVRITFRADGGFCRRRLMRRCDWYSIGYVLGLAGDKVLERSARDEIERAGRQFRRAGQPQRIFGSFSSAAGTWDRARRVIVKAEHDARGANPRSLVVNVPGGPQELHEDVHCQRGEIESRIKEQQLGLFADRTSCHRFLADRFRLLPSSAAYVPVQASRRAALAGTELARAQVGTSGSVRAIVGEPLLREVAVQN